jgi:hypothetical protein
MYDRPVAPLLDAPPLHLRHLTRNRRFNQQGRHTGRRSLFASGATVLNELDRLLPNPGLLITGRLQRTRITSAKFLLPLAVLFLPVIEFELVHVTGDFDAIAVRIEKADGTVARNHKGLRPADDGNLAPLQDGIELVDDII